MHKFLATWAAALAVLAAAAADAAPVVLHDQSDFDNGDGVADGVFRSFSGTLSWYFFADAGGAPGALIAAGNALAPAIVDTGVNTVLGQEDVFELTVTLAAGIDMPAGRGWFGVREGAVGSAYDGTAIEWVGALAAQGAGRYTFFDGAGLGNLAGPDPIDPAFQIIGHPVPEPGSLALLRAAGLAALWQRRSIRPCSRRCPWPENSPSSCLSCA